MSITQFPWIIYSSTTNKDYKAVPEGDVTVSTSSLVKLKCTREKMDTFNTDIQTIR